jgi:hypothetical protein
VLWYTWADPASEYRTSGLPAIAADAASNPLSAGHSWNITLWDSSSSIPTLSGYDVLVIESGAPFLTGATAGTFWPTSSSYASLLAGSSAIEAARGDRTFITATDADFHAIRGDSGNCAPFSGCAQWDGARGHLINAIDWAGSGDGLGVVALLNINEFTQNPEPAARSFWWAQSSSFLYDELLGNYQTIKSSNVAVIDPGATYLPLNWGLTPQGLSDWRNSFHGQFLDSTPGYIEVVNSSTDSSYAYTIATFSWSSFFDGGGLLPLSDNVSSVPEPGTCGFLLLGVGVLAWRQRRSSSGLIQRYNASISKRAR